MQAAVLKRLDAADWAERKQLAASLGALPPGPRETAIAALLARYADDPMAMDAALSGVRGAEATVLENLLSGGVRLKPDAPQVRLKPDATDTAAQSPQREAAITMIAATLIRGGQDLTIQNVLASIADESRPAWQRSALLRGAEVARAGRGDARDAARPARRTAGCRGRSMSDVSWRTRGSRRSVCISAGAAYRAPPAGPPVEPRARGAVRGCLRHRRHGDARHQRAGGHRVARQARRGRSDSAPYGGRAAAVQRRAGGLQEYLPGLPPAGRPRPGAARTEPPRLRAGPRGARHSRARSSQRQGGSRRADAACRIRC